MHDTELGPILLRLARTAIAHNLGRGPRPSLPEDERLHERGASFVTLTENGDLRGCIGSLRRSRPLGEDVIANAIAAATQDPRFQPLTGDELDTVCIEVSVLSEPEFIDFADETALLAQLRPHEDGLILFSGCRSATFLPQVWTQLPTPEAFLAALKRKAGLPTDRPGPGLMAARYRVQKWSEATGAHT